MPESVLTRTVDAFFNSIRSGLPGYRPNIRYFAVRDADELVVAQAGIVLNTSGPQTAPRTLRTSSAQFGIYPLSSVKKDLRELVDGVQAGTLHTPDGEIAIRGRNGVLGVTSIDRNPNNPSDQSRVNSLRFIGDDQIMAFAQQPRIEWELRASDPPYDGLTDALSDFQVGPLFGSSTVEIIALPVAMVDFSSPVNDTSATPTIRLATGLDPNKATLGYRVFVARKVVARKRISGKDLSWQESPHFMEGKLRLEIDKGAHVHCTASYDGQAQHHGWIVRPAQVLNPRRAVYELIDPNLQVLRDLLVLETRAHARSFEAAVAILAWLRGLTIIQLGTVPPLQDGPDLIAETPSGHFAVVECTIGLLKAENKLPSLVRRATAIRNMLDKSFHQNLRLLPVLTTSLPRAQVRTELAAAREHGVVVLAREDLLQAVELTETPPDGDAMFVNLENSLQQPSADEAPG